MPAKTTFIALLLTISLPAQAQVLESDSLALVALYDSTDGANWTITWDLNTPVGTWYGVTVSGGRVTELSLAFNQLSGSIPAELGNLANLEYLHLSSNQLSGSIPAELGNLGNLEVLSLSSNPFSGSIPAELGNLVRLTFLELVSSPLSGSIPGELGNLANLTFLSLAGNQLTGSIPAELGNLAKLKTLYLWSNQLSGSIPAELGNLAKLRYLYLSSNQLSGSIPAELGNLTKLKTLWIDNNPLSGSIPAELGNLANLTNLSLRSNQLTGSIPGELGNLANLTFLSLAGNQLTGSIPAELGNLASLTSLRLYANQLSGAIPAELGNLASLTTLWLDSNQLSGLPDLSALAALNYLQVSNNRLTFEDLEPNMGVASSSFTYVPQDSLDTTIAAGDTLWLTVSAGGTATHYQWMLDGVAITGATDSSVALYPLGSIASGAYICEITNTIVTKLTLYSRPVNVTANGVVIHDDQLLPEQFALNQNYPNPFNPSTTIRFDLLGREVVRLVDGQLQAGYRQQVWNGRDKSGHAVPTGIYFVLVVTPEFRESIKVVLLK